MVCAGADGSAVEAGGVMNLLFAQARLKLDRAAKDIEVVEKELENATAGHERAVTRFLPHAIRMSSPISAVAANEIATGIGNAVHNMRSALDLTLVEAVRLNKKDCRGVAFPFSQDCVALTSPRGGAIKDKHANRAGEDVISLIKSL